VAPLAVSAAGGRGVGILVRLLIHAIAWRLIFHALGGFLRGYTHVPWLGTLLVVAVVAALVRYGLYLRRRRRWPFR
jgi:hypothetical protein